MSDEKTQQIDEKVQNLRESGRTDHELFLELCSELEKTLLLIKEQQVVTSGLMLMVDAAMTMIKIHQERLAAVESRLVETSLQDILDGKTLPPLGPTQEHTDMLLAVNERMNLMNIATKERMDEIKNRRTSE